MRRTEDRPLPSGRLQPDTVLIMGGLCSAIGLVYLAGAVNLLTGLLGAITLVSYLFIYTPLKRVTPLNTAIGAVPGALPPLMGWTAARGEINIEGWSLFAILFFWQLPHFLAIAWMYREDYAKAGFAMLPMFDPDGRRTSGQAVSHTLGLLPISLCPFMFGLEGGIYLIGALLLSLGFVWQGRVMRALPTLGGDNGFATGVNNHGQVVGWAENAIHDPTCNSPQVLLIRLTVERRRNVKPPPAGTSPAPVSGASAPSSQKPAFRPLPKSSMPRKPRRLLFRPSVLISLRAA